MTKFFNIRVLAMAVMIFTAFASASFAQVTTSELVGRVVDGSGGPVAGATVEAKHVPSGTVYNTVSNENGRYNIANMRVGGPYTVKVSGAGFNEQTREGIMLALGTAGTANFDMSTAITGEVTVTADDVFSELKTGSSSNVSNTVVTTLPTISRRVNDFAKLSPHYSGGSFGGSVAGADNRMNNMTVDGSYLNNSFGLSGQAGERTNVSPISLDAIQEFSISVSPYEVRQGNFVGAGINTVTKSGTNKYSGSAYYNWNNQNYIGTKAGDLTFNRGTSKYKLWGLTFGGPLPFFNFGEHDKGDPYFISGKDKLFFFGSYEEENTTRPGHNVVACTTGATCQTSSVSRVLQSDLDQLRSFLSNNFGYETGEYQNYGFTIPAKKFLFKTDYNINDSNRLTLRYMQLDSESPTLISSSSSAGRGRGSTGANFLSFENSNYSIIENIRSFVGEWNTSFGSGAANSLLVGYTTQDESRPQKTKLFPLVDIYQGGTSYTSFGFEPFTPQNTLKYNSLQIQDNVTFFRGSHTISGGVSFEKYHSMNIFFGQSQSVYTYNSLADFYTDANAYLNGTGPTGVPVSRFQVRYLNQPGITEPVQPLDVIYVGFYGQDQWRIHDKFTLTYGLRADVPFFGDTGFANSYVDSISFRDGLKLSTKDLPEANVVWSPRVGFNWSPVSRLQVRGGTGFFSARPPYVWISNQVGNNGVLTGLISQDNTTAYPFNPDPRAYVPATVTGAPVVGQQSLNFAVPDYKFPQIWRSSISADYKLFWGIIGGAEYINTRERNGTAYMNANLANPNANFAGPDARPYWTPTGARVNAGVVEAFTIFNQNIGRSYNLAFTLEKPTSNGLYFKGGYAFGSAKNAVDAGSTAFTSFANNQIIGDPNKPELGYSNNRSGNRVFAAASYHIDYFKFGGTTVSAFWESQNQSVASYRYSNDMNTDGYSNDLMYIPRDASETIFVQQGVFTPAQQSAAWEAFIAQDAYLSSRRGEYAYRNGVLYPMKHNLDFSVTQEVHFNFWKARHRFQFRADILNFGNLLNKNWGGGTFVNAPFTSSSGSNFIQPLAYAGRNAQNQPTFRMNLINGQLPTTTYSARSSLADVYRIQLGVKYSF